MTFEWDEQTNSVVMAKTIVSNGGDGDVFDTSFEVVGADEADAGSKERQTLKFRNEREKAKIKVCKRDSKTDELVPGAVFNLYTQDDIYSADGELLFRAGDLVASLSRPMKTGIRPLSVISRYAAKTMAGMGCISPKTAMAQGKTPARTAGVL